ncbi:MAG TPA: 16S rRNA (guanine(966)-N(2))-methyltransferase RsmD [Bacillota bacterium]|nr:16S rRNA (guanine(966)-N(2))-methyltransferase RsmD [Bacillota bacterium]HPT87621.1 16S rRNA (guanine(966)-N(2))-methyltransferase RsmD [Bacillota bacterium]
MRVISGKYRGRTIQGPKHKGLRPTADRVKEALFNIIGARIDGAVMLDLFAGTGGVGIEALSRGAQAVVFSDVNPQSIKLLRQNLAFLDPEDNVRVLQLRAEKTLELMAKEKQQFDLIFVDPPYEAGLFDKTIRSIKALDLLKTDGILVIEHPDKMRDFLDETPFELVSTRTYGDIALTFLVHSKE